MERKLIKEIFSKSDVDYKCVVKGWVRSVRKSKAFSFIALNDGTTQDMLQIIADQDLANYEQVSAMTTGFCVAIEGTIVASGGKGQSVEMQASSVSVLGGVGEDYPLQKKRIGLEKLREIAHFRARTNTFGAVFRVRHCLAQATHRFFSDKGFYYLNSPIISPFDGEGAGEMFHVTTHPLNNIPKNDKGEVDFSSDYFGKEVNLCVTGQLEGEAFALAMGAVYTFGPTFRAENSNTARHLAEFWMVEPEMAFAELEDVMKLGADYIQYMISAALKECPDELKFFDKMFQPGLLDTLKHVAESDFAHVSYTDAIKILEESGEKFEFLPKWGSDLQTEHERYLTEKHFKRPTIVTDYPKEFKAFYMRLNDDGKTVRAMDILVPGVGEIIGGSQREERLDILEKRMQECELEKEEYEWYLDLRRHGGCKHAGFGLGFERAVQYITGMANIRDVIPFPRTPKNCEF